VNGLLEVDADRDGRGPAGGRTVAERMSQPYEQGVDLIHIRAFVPRLLWRARSGLLAMGAGLSEWALKLVVRSGVAWVC
jgi:hypothetical protein